MKKQDTFLVVTLIALSISGEMVAAETPIEVDRATRADWRGSKLARDATEEEIAEYYADQDDDTAGFISGQVDALAKQKGDLEDEIFALEKARTALQEEVAQLTANRDQLAKPTEPAAPVEPKAKAAK